MAGREVKLICRHPLSGGNVYDQYTGGELAQAHEGWPDLLCVRLYPVSAGRPFSEVEPIYVDLKQLKGMTGHGWVIQNRIECRSLDGRFVGLNIENNLSLAYELVESMEGRGVPAGSSFILDANRRASMLFDADPDSSAHWIPLHLPGFLAGGHACVQRFNLGNQQVDPTLHSILAEVQGRWTGTVYSRDFERHDGKPYVFLGRHRLLVRRASALHDRLANLKAEGRLLAIISLIVGLQEDDAGYRSESLRDLL